MKKTLVAIAALAAVGAAFAQSSVTLYGRIDASIGNVKTTVGGVTTSDPGVQIRSGAHSGSRWGLKGTEDLGGGLKANFTLEQGFNIDDGQASSTRQFHRVAAVGLQGGFGRVDVGRQYDITDTIYATYDAAGYSSLASAMGYVFNVGCNTGGSGDCIARQDNSVKYTTPSMGGLSAVAMWAPGEDKTAAGTSKMAGAMVNYNNGPLGLGVGWQSNKPRGQRARTDIVFGAQYNLGVARLYALIEEGKNKQTAGTGKDSGYAIGAVLPMGAASLTVSYAGEKQKIGGTKVSDAKAIGLIGRYDLSKRTYVYAGYRRGETDPTGVNNTSKTQQYALGLVHDF